MSDSDAFAGFPFDKIISIRGKKIKESLPIVTTWIKGLVDAGLTPWEILHLVNCIHIEMQQIGVENGQNEDVIRAFLKWSTTHWQSQKFRSDMRKGKLN